MPGPPPGDRIAYSDTPMEALKGADALILVTEWNEFRRPDFDRVRELLKDAVIFDGRNIYDPGTLHVTDGRHQARRRHRTKCAVGNSSHVSPLLYFLQNGVSACAPIADGLATRSHPLAINEAYQMTTIRALDLPVAAPRGRGEIAS